MDIRRSVPEDIEEIEIIYARARRFMAENGNPNQWAKNGWPPRDVIEKDVEDGISYVCIEGGEIVGVFCYLFGENIEPTYGVIEGGNWAKDAPYGVIHRIASSGKIKGVGEFCIKQALEKSGYLRIDTHPDNIVMQNLLLKLGFTRRGIIHVRQDNDPRIAFDNLLFSRKKYAKKPTPFS